MRESTGYMELVGTWVRSAIQSASWSDHPWPHLIVGDLFPDKVFSEMLNHLPHPSRMEQFKQHRQFLWLVKYGEYQALADPFWQTFRDVVLPELRGAVEEKFGCRGVKIGAEIVRDTPGYSLGPHTDDPDKLITGVIYLPRTQSEYKLGAGTQLWSGPPDPAGKGHDFGEPYKFHNTVSFFPNSALMFTRTDTSFHAVGLVTEERWSLAFDIFK